MQVLLVATNEQPKLWPLTSSLAAPLLPVANRPVMAIAVEILARAGYKQLLASLYQRGGSIAAYFGAGRRWGVQIDYITQREPWGSAGTLRWAASLIHEAVLVWPADMLLDLDVADALAFHQASGSALTLIAARDRDCQIPKPLLVDPDGRALLPGSAPLDRPATEFTGAFICEPHLIQHIPARTVYDTYHQLVPAVLAAGEAVYVYETHAYWNPLTTFSEYQEAQRVFLYSAYQGSAAAQAGVAPPQMRYASIEGQQIAPGIWVAANSVIHPNARLAPPLCIGEGCRIGYGAELGPEVVIGSSVVVDDEATVQHSTILRRTYVGKLVNVAGRIVHHSSITDITTSESTDVVDSFLLSEVGPSIVNKHRLIRATQVLIAGIALLLLLPVLLMLSLAVCIFAGRRVLRRVPRMGVRAADLGRGVGPKRFKTLVFCTQKPDGTAHVCGRWMQRWELERLPELWNVITGDLALVGVRPMSPVEVASLQEAWEQKRNEYPAGFTGLWYVHGTHSHGLEASLLEASLIDDAYYTATRSWQGDLGLICRTPQAWWRRRRLQSARPPVTQEYFSQVDEMSGT